MLSNTFFIVCFAFLNLTPATVRGSESCPYSNVETDAFRFNIDVGMLIPTDFAMEEACSDAEMETIVAAYETALDGAKVKPELGIVDITTDTICLEAGQGRKLGKTLHAANVYLWVFRGGGACNFCAPDDYDYRRSLRSNNNNTSKDQRHHRRTTTNGDICGCQSVTFSDTVSTMTDSTDEYLTSNGIIISGSGDSTDIDFVQPVLVDSITASDDSTVDIHHLNGDSFTLDNGDESDGSIEPIPVASLTISDGSISNLEYCFEACPEAQATFDDETSDIEAELRAILDESLNAASVPCLDSVEVLSVVHITPVAIDQPSAC